MENKLAAIDDIANKTFDFVIIGGGTAGCAVASRLTENPNVSVAVLEAGNGHLDDPLITSANGWPKQMFNPEYDWVFRTTQQKKALNGGTTPTGAPDPSFYWSRGKGLGGTSAMNAMYWTKPHREEVDAVEKLGNPGWGWDSFFKASKRSETFYPTSINNDPEYLDLYGKESLGTSGPIAVSFARTVSGIEKHFQKALKAFGVDVVRDPFGGDVAGTLKSASSLDIRTGTRSSAVTGYLKPALERSNLKVLTAAYVRRIITTNAGEVVATGVEFEHGGQVHVVNVAKEAILSAGTIKSPHVLELSGIGDRAVLDPLGIPVQLHLPSVGTNLQDHLLVAASVFQMRDDKGFVTSDTIQHADIAAQLGKIYGPDNNIPISLVITGVTFAPVQAFSDRPAELIKSVEERVKDPTLPIGLKEQYAHQLDMLKRKDVPDIELLVFPYNMTPHGGGKPIIGVLPSIGRPFSRGTIHTGSTDPNVQPVIDPNYFSESVDLDILLDGMKFLRKLTAKEEWKDICEKEVFPGPEIVTDEQMLEHIRHFVSSSWHACGTCSMMPKEKGGVVDTHLKVYGTKNIRVVDLSVLPLLTAVHPQTTVYSIAEHASVIIKADNAL